MALKPCKECGNEISDKAKSCPQCGAEQPKKTSFLVKVLAWIFGLGIFFSIIGGIFGKNNHTDNPAATSVSDSTAATEVVDQKKQEPKNWIYDSSKDELHNSETKFASTQSLNTVRFDFPYDGGSNLILTVRKNHAGNDVYIAITKGQFLCNVVDGCDVEFKFDDGQIMNVTMSESDSHASDVLFVGFDSTEQKIINKLKTSKKLIIAPKFYQYGNLQFTFDVSNYKSI